MKNLINQNIVFRCDKAGTWAGTVTEVCQDFQKIKVSNAHRLWNWQAKDGISLSEVATNGVCGGKICKPVAFVYLNNADVYEAISMTDEAFNTIKSHAKDF